MRICKKCFGLLLAALMIFSCLTFIASAASNESESNDTYATANTLSPNGSISGTMSNEFDTDMFKVTTSANGKLNITLKHTYENVGRGWSITVYCYAKGSYTELIYYGVALSDSESVLLPTIGAVSSGVYYVKVEDMYRQGASVEKRYTIETSFTATNYYEKELNNDYASATVMSLNTTYGGTMSTTFDDDFYKITVPSNGKLSLDFRHTYKEVGRGWNIYIYCLFNGTYTQLCYYGVDLDDTESMALPTIGAVPSGVYYVKVEDMNRQGYSVGENYSIRANFSATEYYEKELNDSIVSATAMNLNSTYGGTISTTFDTDYYKFIVSKADTISVAFTHSYENTAKGWQITVYQYSGDKFNQLTDKYISLSDNEITEVLTINAKASEVFYVKISDQFNQSYSVGKEYSLTASNNCTVTYNANGGSVSPTGVSVASGNSTTLPTPTRSGYICLGWATSSSATSATYSCGASYKPIANVTLYAVWKAITYTVAYNANGGSVSPTTVSVTSGNSTTLPTPTRSGYTCLGWSTSSTATTATYSCGASYKPISNVTLYAVWKANSTTYTITYNANGGSVSPTSVSVTSGNSTTLPTPTRSGYTCLGWATSSTATTATYSCGASYKPSSNGTLYAVWKTVKSSVKSVSIVDKLTLTYKKTAIISPIIEADNGANYTVTYTTSNSKVATVDASGKVTATGKGTATITCTVTNNDDLENVVETTCKVTVKYAWWQMLIRILLLGFLWY